MTSGHVAVGGPVVVARPHLAVVGPGIWVVEDYHEPVFYTGGFYWASRGGIWYRSRYHHTGFIRVHNHGVPVVVRGVRRPHTYVRYRARGRVYAPSRNVHAPRRSYGSSRRAYAPSRRGSVEVRRDRTVKRRTVRRRY